jgi:hypothetical protein
MIRGFFMKLAAIAGCFVLLIWSPASAQIIGDPRCKDQKFTSDQVAKIDHSIKSVVNMVEGVPPDEANYLRNEMQAALEQSNKVRFNAVTNRRYFAAFQFHEDAKVVLQNLDAAKTASGRDLARYLIVVLSRMGDLQVAMNQYVSTDLGRSPSVLRDSDRQEMFFAMPASKGKTVSLLQCVVSVL